MKAIILAAGRGSRMLKFTDDRPKCLVEIAGQSLLSWQLLALCGAGITDIAVVGGYRSEMIAATRKDSERPFSLLTNPNWESTNMLSTLLCASEWIAGEECVVSYSDIVYPAGHVRALLRDESPIALTYDARWEELWRLRQDGDPLVDAETFLEKNGRLKEIGAQPHSLDEVQGQYMGLLKITPAGWKIILSKCGAIGEKVAKTDMTSFLRMLLEDNIPIGAVRVEGQWCEVDSDEDLACYQAVLSGGHWSHDWRA